MMKKHDLKFQAIVRILLFTLGFFLLLYIPYFLFVVLVQSTSAKRLVEAKKTLEEARLNLSQESVLYYRFFVLDPESPTFATNKSDLLSTLIASNQKAIDYFSKTPRQVSTFYVNSKSGQLLKKINIQIPVEFKKTKSTLTSQKEVLDEINKSESILKNIFAYDPIYDFSDLKDKEGGGERATIAVVNLQKIGNKISDSTLPDKEDLLTKLDVVLANLSDLSYAFRFQNDILIKTRYDSLQKSLYELKKTAYGTQKNILRSQKGLLVLTDFTNQISFFDDLITEISLIQNDLNKDPLSEWLAKMTYIRQKKLIPKLTR